MPNYFEMLGLAPCDLLSREAVLEVVRSAPKGAHYVYSLWIADRAEPKPFYIGKGTGRRVLGHEASHQRAVNSVKWRILSRMRSKGIRPNFAIHAMDVPIEDALALEINLIARVGRLIAKTGPLANITEGGEGIRGMRGENGYTSIPVIAEGRRFSCFVEADAALGIHKGRTRYLVENGHPGYYREGQPQKMPWRKGHPAKAEHPMARAVVADGTRYGLLGEAAAALGVGSPCIIQRINFGWPGYYYEDQGQLPQDRPRQHSVEHLQAMRNLTDNTPKCVSVSGEAYRSLSAAGAALNVSYRTIRNRCLNPKFPDYSLI